MAETIQRHDYKQMLKLAFPIFIEIMLRTLMGNIDQFMLSRYSSTAVASVGNANQVMNMMILVLNVVCVASTIIIAQYIGAGKREELSQIYSISIFLNIGFSLILSVVVLFSRPILELMRVPEELKEATQSYFMIVGAAFILQGISMSFSAIFRSNALMKEIMSISIFSNLCNVFGNLILINGAGPIPALGVRGAAFSTVGSQFISVCLILYLYIKRVGVKIKIQYILKGNAGKIKNLFRIGIPAAGDSISYNVMQLVMLSFINRFGAAASSTKAYVGMIAIFVYMCSSAVAQATQIKVGYAIGAGQEERAKRLVMKSVRTSLLLSCTFAVLLYLGSNTVFSIFTQDPEILKLAKSVMKIDMFLEAGRAVNMVMVSSLLAAGDTKTPLVCGILSMWCLAIPAGYLLGVVMELGITGVWIGFAADEWCRAIAFLIRWRSNAWQNKKIRFAE
ncbi:MATE family efflux transporter [Hungatella hathewayi]|uniref:MATE family efflux transporter n=1 Tax=Hungatella hathewayi TaxID=154046 RepID=UPI00110A32A2|nr:MATE family efflux transporter [Hungatella hathewayi]MBS4985127.1 MATE family efflux transporter [Hungatella hathewayi]